MRLPVTTREAGWEEIARRISIGDEVALKQFLIVFPAALASYFFNRDMPASEAEDLAVTCVTDIALEIANSKYRCRGEGSFAGWVFTIAHHRFVDCQRQSRPHVALPEELSVPEAAPEDEADFRRILAVQEALVKLSAMDQEIIRLRYFGAQHSYKEIGELLNISTDNARVRHHRARKDLRKTLEKDPRLTWRHASPDHGEQKLCGITRNVKKVGLK